MAYTKLNLADGDTLKAEHLAHMETELAREKSWNELADKPFGETLTEIMAETEVTGVDNDGMYEVSLDSSLFSGTETELVVIFDGVEYTCAANTDMGATVFGNLLLLGGNDTGEPFCILVDYGVCIVEDAEVHTLGIYNNEVQKIADKYINKQTMFYFDVAEQVYVYTDATLSTKASVEQIFWAFSGSPVVIAGISDGIVRSYVFASKFYANSSSGGMVLEIGGISPFKLYTAEYTAEE